MEKEVCVKIIKSYAFIIIEIFYIMLLQNLLIN